MASNDYNALIIRMLAEQLREEEGSRPNQWAATITGLGKSFRKLFSKGSGGIGTIIEDQRIYDTYMKKDQRSAAWMEHITKASSCEAVTPEDGSLVLYSCVTQDYDAPLPPFHGTEMQETCLLYTDSADGPAPGWEVRGVPESLAGDPPVYINRYLKFHPFEYAPGDFSVYVDGNVWVLQDPASFCRTAAGAKAGVAIFAHRRRDCLYQEGEACIALGKGNADGIREQLDYARSLDIPEHWGLMECCVIAVDHANPTAKVLMDAWWEEFQSASSGRDQLALPCALKKLGMSFEDLGVLGTDVRNDPRVRQPRHL